MTGIYIGYINRDIWRHKDRELTVMEL